MQANKKPALIDNKHKAISRKVASQFASIIRENNPALIAFVEHYYKWMESPGNVLSQIYMLPDITDIDKTPEEFLYYFLSEVMPTIPSNIITNKRLLVKHIKDLYMHKGTESALKFLFKILFNETVEIEYPSDVILRCSDGVWVKTASMKTSSATNISLLGRKVYGRESGANAIVDKVSTIDLVDIVINEIELSSITGAFLVDEIIETRDTLESYSNFPKGQIRVVTITDPGTGYFINEPITPPSAFRNAELVVGEINDIGGIVKVKIINGGYGYTSSSNSTNVNSKGANLTFNVGAVIYNDGEFTSERGKLSSICVLQDGFKYQEFSYVIKSVLSITYYKDIVTDTTHPAGTLMLGEVTITQNTNTMSMTTSTPEVDII